MTNMLSGDTPYIPTKYRNRILLLFLYFGEFKEWSEYRHFKVVILTMKSLVTTVCQPFENRK